MSELVVTMEGLGKLRGSLTAKLKGAGVVAERCTEARGFAGRAPAVNALSLVRGSSGVDRGVANVRDARMFGLKQGGEGVRPVSWLARSTCDIIESSS
jgi:hypothetical protein